MGDPAPGAGVSVSLGVRLLADVRAASCAAVKVPPDQVKAGALALTVWGSSRSTSVKVGVRGVLSRLVLPVVLRASWMLCGPEASGASTGAALLPVMVIVTGWVELAPLLSVTVTV